MVHQDIGFQRLAERVAALGSHQGRFLRMALRKAGELERRLEEKGLRHRVWLWDRARDIPSEMETVSRMGRDREEKLAFLGAYQALQLIHLNLSLLDALGLEISRSLQPARARKVFLLSSAEGFQALLRAYMSKVLEILLPSGVRPEFAILNVGSRWDRDDLDVCVLDDGSPGTERLRRAVSRLSTEMLRYATRMDFHVAEEAGGNAYSGTVEHFREFLEKTPRDFVSVSEMLSADLILGSSLLFEKFRRQVKGLFYYDEGGNNIHHETFFRGNLGEILLLATRPLDPTLLRPKEDAIRPLKGILCLSKSLYKVEAPDPLTLLEALRRRMPQDIPLYDELEDHILFFETFRQLYHFYVEETEEIPIPQPGLQEEKARIAGLMGYEDAGPVTAWQGLVFRYHQKVRLARNLVLRFVDRFKVHLGRTTFFAPFLQSSPSEQGKAGLVELVRAARRFRGVGYWDDILDRLEEDPALVESLLREAAALPRRPLEKLLLRISSGAHRTTRGVMRLITLLQKHAHREGVAPLVQVLVKGFLDTLAAEGDLPLRLVQVFLLDSRRVCHFLGSLSEEEQRRVAEILKKIEMVDDEPVSGYAAQIRRLSRLFYSHSRYFQRFFLSVVERHPYVVSHLSNPEFLDRIAHGLRAWGQTRPTFPERREALGDSFDMERVRLGLLTLGSPSKIGTGESFERFFIPFFSQLYHTCLGEVLEETGALEMADVEIGLFLAGGTARGDTFSEDCDLFALCNREEEAPFLAKVLQRVGKELGRRGLMPHFCLADHLGPMVSTLDQVKRHFRERWEPPLVETSILLGSRFAAGEDHFRRALDQEVIHPILFEKAAPYIRGMAAQVKKACCAEDERLRLDLKEGPGGLRCQEMILLALLAAGKLRKKITPALPAALAERWPEIERPLKDLSESMVFFRQLRDLYWVTVAATNLLDPAYLSRPSRFLGIRGGGTQEGGKRLLEIYTKTQEKSARACVFLAEWALARLG